jgi:hypothetical protein
MRGYRAPLLEQRWIDRFVDELTPFADPEERAAFQRFNGATEMLGFLVHFDNRSGLSDTGPYPHPDGGFLIVRDHFLQEEPYAWSTILDDGLPYAVTEVLHLRPDTPLDLQLVDIGTLFTEPANYLAHLQGAAVYARDRWDTPADQVRLLGADEQRRIADACTTSTERLYRHIAAMSQREKTMAGAKVYATDFLLPYARAAGVWRELETAGDFHELDPVASEAYYDLVRDGVAQELVPRLFLTGGGFPVTPPLPELDPAARGTLRGLVLRGTLPDVGDAGAVLEEHGLASSTPAGWLPTEQGLAVDRRLSLAEQGGADLGVVRDAYARFLAANGPFKALVSRWQGAGEDERWAMAGDLAGVVDRAEPALTRIAGELPRVGAYAGRLRAALERVEAGEHEWVTAHDRDSLHTVWMEAHEDLLQTLGISREEEGSF